MEASSVTSVSDDQVVTIRLGPEIYGVPIARVEAIISWEPLTCVPQTPAYVPGILSVRGSVLPVLDMRVRLGLEASAPTPSHRILILQVEGMRFGAIVDGVRSVEHISEDRIERDIALTTSISDAFINGVAQMDGSLVILLKPEGLLGETERRRMETFAQ